MSPSKVGVEHVSLPVVFLTPGAPLGLIDLGLRSPPR